MRSRPPSFTKFSGRLKGLGSDAASEAGPMPSNAVARPSQRVDRVLFRSRSSFAAAEVFRMNELAIAKKQR